MTVIVGVDGSVGGYAAFSFAVDEAVRRRSGLRVVAVVHLAAGGLAAITGLVAPAPAVLLDDVRKAVQLKVDEAVATREDLSGVSPTVEALAGQPGHVLCEAAGDADLLVVGRSGHGSVTGGLLGSVCLHCVLHARCPVTVVQHPAIAGRSG